MNMNHAFNSREEWRAAHADEVEFADIARALKALAHELGQEPDSLLRSMAERGLPATLGHLARSAVDVEARYARCRLSGRAA
jgi:hypothetical protein